MDSYHRIFFVNVVVRLVRRGLEVFAFSVAYRLVDGLRVLDRGSVHVTAVVDRGARVIFPQACVSVFRVESCLVRRLDHLLRDPSEGTSSPRA